MLSRVAETLYWMSRYLERAEHTTRMLDLNLYQMLDQSPDQTTQRWDRLRASFFLPPLPLKEENDVDSLTEFLIFDLKNSVSVMTSIMAARENARQIREQISSEMWEQLNRLFLQIKRTSMDELSHAEPHEFFVSVKEGIHLFRGITDATMSHSDGWQFIQLGQYIERATVTTTLLDVYFKANLESQFGSPSLDYLEWVGLLKSCTAFEAYCKVYTANIQPQLIAEFLLLNAESPRSVRFAVDMIESTLQAIARSAGGKSSGLASRLAGRLRASLDYAQVEEIMNENMHDYLENIQNLSNQIHAAIYALYITYPIDVVLGQQSQSQSRGFQPILSGESFSL